MNTKYAELSTEVMVLHEGSHSPTIPKQLRGLSYLSIKPTGMEKSTKLTLSRPTTDMSSDRKVWDDPEDPWSVVKLYKQLLTFSGGPSFRGRIFRYPASAKEKKVLVAELVDRLFTSLLACLANNCIILYI